MDYEKFDELKLDYVLGKLTTDEMSAVAAFLSEHPEVNEQVELLQEVYSSLSTENVPEASERMDEQFYALLKQEVNEEQLPTALEVVEEKIYFSISKLFLKRSVFAILLLVIGYIAGSNFGYRQVDSTISQGQSFSNEDAESIRKELVLALIGQPSASKRLQAVAEAGKLDKVTEVIVNALFRTLNNDPNANVRLAAVESLAKYSDNSLVREGLIKSLDVQDAPLVQIALADLMVKIQEKKSLEPMKKLLEQPDTNETVRQKLAESIEKII